MHFRGYREGDAGALARVFYDSIHKGPGPYTDDQRAAWLPRVPHAGEFAVRLNQMFVAVAEERGKPIGFMGMKTNGYIELVFVLHECRGQGVFRYPYETIETRARESKCCRLWTHASLMAQPAFLAQGFCVMLHEAAARNGQLLARAEMEKRLT